MKEEIEQLKDVVKQLKNVVEQLVKKIDKDYFIGYDENDKMVLKNKKRNNWDW